MPDFEKMTQNEMVIYHLKNHKTLTQRMAQDLYGIMRLPARISELRRQGYPIKTKNITGKSRFKKSCTFAEYSLEDVG